MAQTAGYLIAALGPFAAGYTRSVTGGWTVPIVVLLEVLVPFTADLLIARPRTLKDEVARTHQQPDHRRSTSGGWHAATSRQCRTSPNPERTPPDDDGIKCGKKRKVHS